MLPATAPSLLVAYSLASDVVQKCLQTSIAVSDGTRPVEKELDVVRKILPPAAQTQR
jgi:hypothetical protein